MSKGHMEALAALKARRNVTRVVTRADGSLVVPAKAMIHLGTGVVKLRAALQVRPTAGEKCPTCGCKVPKRQRDSRACKKAKA